MVRRMLALMCRHCRTVPLQSPQAPSPWSGAAACRASDVPGHIGNCAVFASRTRLRLLSWFAWNLLKSESRERVSTAQDPCRLVRWRSMATTSDKSEETGSSKDYKVFLKKCLGGAPLSFVMESWSCCRLWRWFCKCCPAHETVGEHALQAHPMKSRNAIRNCSA